MRLIKPQTKFFLSCYTSNQENKPHLGEDKSNRRSKWLTDFVFRFTVSGVVELPLVLCQEVRHRAEDLDLRKIFKYKQ